MFEGFYSKTECSFWNIYLAVKCAAVVVTSSLGWCGSYFGECDAQKTVPNKIYST